MAFFSSAQLIENLKKEIGLDVDFVTIIKVWNNEICIDKTEIIGYKSGTIFASTKSSAALAEVSLRKKEIIKKLNQYLGISKIKNIKITIQE
ncbi:MAG: DUF721 domain-containing protein [Elusimicrobiota bacterium]|jgi:hypothetical protein|nr:DUF721 domain-containing protein [Elusimicrobiota bacterium]